MAAEPITWLPLEEIKRELRIPPGVSDEDGMLVRQVSAAVRFVESEVGLPLIDKTEEVVFENSNAGIGDKLRIGYVLFLKEGMVDLFYEPADSNMPGSNLNSAAVEFAPGTNQRSWNKLWFVEIPEEMFAPGEKSLPGSKWTITYRYGMDPANHADVTQALILLVRDFYQGGQQNLTIFSTQAYERILAPLYLLGMKDYAPHSDR